MRRKNFRVERTNGDDILDALSLRINQNLRTEKEIDDKKNNVYFWLFKFLILIVYLLIINGIFFLVKEFGVYLIYLFAVSLRSVLSFIFKTGLTFVQLLLTTYILLKNLKIFTKSSYYKRLYAKDRYMLKKKRAFFGTVENILQAFGVVFLVFIGCLAVVLTSIITMLITLAINRIFMISLLAISIILLILCFFVFLEIRKKFFGINSNIRKEHLYVGLLELIFCIVCFGYETNNYKMDAGLPESMPTIRKAVLMNVYNIDNIEVSSNAKFNNVEVILDNSLDDLMKVEVEYYKTADVSYVSYFNESDDLQLKFDGEIEFGLDDITDVFRLGIETIRTKTMYNYNMFKYPKVRIYAGPTVYDKIKLDK